MREEKPRYPEQFFVSDITYAESDEGVHYLSLISDAHSRKIMGHSLGRSLKAEESVRALDRAKTNRQWQTSLIHHTDRGIQYCSGQYQQCLKQYGMRPSITDGYNCY